MASWIVRCADCQWENIEEDYYVSCPSCKGFLEVQFPDRPTQLPDKAYSSIFQYHELLPIREPIDDYLNYENIEDTPIIFAENLSNYLDVELHYKDETLLPTGTWKDREGFISIYRLLDHGINDLFVFSSGNTGTSLARTASIIKGPKLHLVMPESTRNRIKNSQEFFDPNFIKIYYFSGSNDECIEEANRIATEKNIQVEGGFSNYARREGLKLFGLEVALKWEKRADWYVQAVAGGIGIYGLYKAYADLGREDECPKMLGVQAEICAPMVNAWKAKSKTLEEFHIPKKVIPSPYVRVLRTRNPADSYPVLKKIMDKINGYFEAVSDHEIKKALDLFYLDDYYQHRYQSSGTLIGLEPATALAGILKGIQEGYIKKGERVLLNVSGAAKSGDVDSAWIKNLITKKGSV